MKELAMWRHPMLRQPEPKFSKYMNMKIHSSLYFIRRDLSTGNDLSSEHIR